jgi:hypothetical protein
MEKSIGLVSFILNPSPPSWGRIQEGVVLLNLIISNQIHKITAAYILIRDFQNMFLYNQAGFFSSIEAVHGKYKTPRKP